MLEREKTIPHCSCTNTRLMRDLSRLMRSDTEKLGFSLQLKDDDALDEWNINLFGFSDCPLAEVRTKIIVQNASSCSVRSRHHLE